MAPTFKDIWAYMAPFLAALLASAMTYVFGMRAKRGEVALAERLAAFHVLRERLVSFARWCEAAVAETEGVEWAPRIDDLPSADRRAALQHRADLHYAVQDRRHLLSPAAREQLAALEGDMDLICSMQIARAGASSDEYSEGAAKLYRRVGEAALACVDHLYREMQLPR